MIKNEKTIYQDGLQAGRIIGRQAVLETVKATILSVCEGFSERTFENTMKGKKGPWEVTDKNWEDSSFTFEEMADKVVEELRRYTV